MKKIKSKALSIILLTFVPSFVTYFILYAIYRDPVTLLKDLLTQLAFLPLFYFFSSLVIERIMVKREKEEQLKKIKMLIGIFFSEVGNKLIKQFLTFDPDIKKFSPIHNVSVEWKAKDFYRARKSIKALKYDIDSTLGDLALLREFLINKRSFLAGMMENSNLLEHETFTELIIAIFHLCEEFEYRDSLYHLPESDYLHLTIDMKRVYLLLNEEWLLYMEHIKIHYPYLFSLAIRTNPYLIESSAIVK